MVEKKKNVFKQPEKVATPPEEKSFGVSKNPEAEQKQAEQQEKNTNWQVVGWLNWTKSRNALHVKYGADLIGCISVKSMKEMLEGVRDSVAICAVLNE